MPNPAHNALSGNLANVQNDNAAAEAAVDTAAGGASLARSCFSCAHHLNTAGSDSDVVTWSKRQSGAV